MPKPTPNIARFVKALQAIAARQVLELSHRLTAQEILKGTKADLSSWVDKMVDSVRPFLIKEYRQGMRRAMMDHQAQLPGRRIDPRVLRGKMLVEVDLAARTFIVDSLAKVEAEANQVLKVIRRQLKNGKLTGHQAKVQLNRHLREALGDSNKAKVTAEYHSHALGQQGQQLLARELGARSKTWICEFGPRSCKVCRQLHLKTVALDEPFIVLPGGGPYAVVMRPGLHPWCKCITRTGMKPVKPRKKSWEEIEIEERVKRG